MKTGNWFVLSKATSLFRVLACAALATTTATQNLRAHDQNLPWDFNAIVTIASEEVDPSDSTHTTEVDIGKGHSTHLGVVSVVMVNQDYFVIDPTIGPALSVTGEGTLTGADGSTLTFALEALIPYNPPTFPFQAKLTITGGTGRMSGATGVCEGDGYLDENRAFHFQATGDLTPDKSRK